MLQLSGEGINIDFSEQVLKSFQFLILKVSWVLTWQEDLTVIQRAYD